MTDFSSMHRTTLPGAPTMLPVIRAPWSDRRWNLLAISVLLVLSIPWWLALQYPLIVFDDYRYIRDNPNVLGGITRQNMAWAFSTTYTALWQPLTWLSLMLDSSLFGTSTSGYHATNFILHTANSLLLFFFLRDITKNPGRSLFAAAFFAIHPLRVESVVWITERKDVLFAFFGLLSLICYARYARAQPRRRTRWYIAALLLYLASLLAKTMLITMPVLLLLLDWWPLGRLSPSHWKRPVLEKIPFLVAGLGVGIYTLMLMQGAHVTPPITMGYRLQNTVWSYWMYLRDQFYFLDLSLFYPLGSPISGGAVAFAIIFYGMVTLSLAYLSRRFPATGRPLLFGWLFFIVAISPLSGIAQAGSQARADRFTYFPSIGVAVLLGWLIPERSLATAKARHYAAFVGVAGIAVLCVYCTLRILVWRDPMFLYQDGIARAGGSNPMLEANLGWSLYEQGKIDEALAVYEHAVNSAPESSLYRFGYARVLLKANRLPDSYRELSIAHRLAPWDEDITGTYDRMLAFIRELQAQTQKGTNSSNPRYHRSGSHMKTHRLGIIMNGVTGRMGTNQHLYRSLAAIMRQGGVRFTGAGGAEETIIPEPLLIGRNADKLQRVAAGANLPDGALKVSTDLTAALADPHYSIYFDAQTTDRRVPAVQQAIAAGKHIYCEKPTATTTADALALWHAAKQKGVKNGVVQDKLWLPGIMKLKQLIASGFFGEILSVRGEFGYWVFEGDTIPPQRPSWNYRKEDGGGVIIDMLCHWRYLIDNVFGTIKSVSCLGATHVKKRWNEQGKAYDCTADDSAYSTFELHNGIMCHFNSSWCVRVRRDDLLTLQVDGTKGSAVAGLRDCVSQQYNNTPRPVWNPDIDSPIDFFGTWSKVPAQQAYDNAFKIQWELFLKHVVTNSPFPWNLLEAAKGVQLAELGLQSWSERRWLDLPNLE